MTKTFLPRQIRTRGFPPESGSRQREGRQGEGCQGDDKELPGDDKELLEAGGDLPSPQGSATLPEADNGGRFPLWRVAGMILSTGVFGFALYRLVART